MLGASTISLHPSAGIRESVKSALSVGSTPHRTIFREGALTLIRYEGEGSKGPLVLIPSLINRHYILDLLPGKSFVAFLVSEGYSVYLIRWEEPEAEDRYLTADRLIGGRIFRAVRAVLRDSDAEKVSLVGQCLGGTIAALFSVRYPELVEKQVLLTTPVDFANSGLIGKWAQAQSVDLSNLLDGHGNMPAHLMQAAFQFLRPVSGVTKYLRALRKWDDQDFLKSFVALELWANDNIDFPGHCYQTLIQSFYQNNGFVEGVLRINGARVYLKDLKTPTLSLASPQDHIVPPQTTLKREHFQGADFEEIVTSGGHIGAILGKKSQTTVWPRIAQWLA